MLTKLTHPHHLLPLQHELGEGPTWHPSEERLYWVNIEAGEIHRCNEDGGQHEYWQLPTAVGALGFCQSGGLILAMKAGFARWQPGAPQLTEEIRPKPVAGRRFNDGKVDPRGGFVAGTLADAPVCALYRLKADGTIQVLQDGIGISNGLDWSPDRRWFYFTDTPTQTIYRYRYHLRTGLISQREPFIVVPAVTSEGLPDGLCVDAEGYLWSARWGGWKVVRYHPHGYPVAEIDLPAAQVTSCAFGGRHLDTLFITTARQGLDEAALKKQPLAGDLFAIKPGVKGMPVNNFAG